MSRVTTLSTSAQGIAYLHRKEGWRADAYLCPAGVWTIGWGRTRGVRPGMRATRESEEIEFRRDLAEFENAVNRWHTQYRFTQNEFDALVSFAYNCGIGNLNRLTQHGRRTKAQIADAILLYDKANDKPLHSLTIRRREEREMFLRGVY